MNLSAGKHKLSTFPTLKVSNLGVSIGFKVNYDPECVASIFKGNKVDVEFSKKTAVSILCVALFQSIQSKMNTSAKDTSQFKLAGTSVGLSSDSFSINYITQPSLTAMARLVKKTVGLMQVVPLYSMYAELCKGSTTHRPNRDDFDDACKTIQSGISQGMTIVAVGRYNTKSETNLDKLKAIGSFVNAWRPSEIEKRGGSPSKLGDTAPVYPGVLVSADGWSRYFLQNILAKQTKFMQYDAGSGIRVITDEKRAVTVLSPLANKKENIEVLMKRIYTSDEMYGATGFSMIQDGMSAYDVSDFITSKPKPTAIASDIVKTIQQFVSKR
jgi:hypothetical protein